MNQQTTVCSENWMTQFIHVSLYCIYWFCTHMCLVSSALQRVYDKHEQKPNFQCSILFFILTAALSCITQSPSSMLTLTSLLWQLRQLILTKLSNNMDFITFKMSVSSVLQCCLQCEQSQRKSWVFHNLNVCCIQEWFCVCVLAPGAGCTSS